MMSERNQEGGLRQAKSLWQFVKFALVGVSNTFISEIVYAILVFFRVHYLAASFLGFSISVLNAYYWNNKYVFKEDYKAEERVWWKVLGKTYIAYFWGYLVSALLLVFWIDILKIARWMGPIEDLCRNLGFESMDAYFWGNLLAAFINLMITVPMNYVLNKYWAYRQKKSEK